MKKLHRYLTFLVLPLLLLLSGTGAILSLQPTIERFNAPVVSNNISVADVAAMATDKIDGIERIRRSANGQIMVDAYNMDGAQILLLDMSKGTLVEKPKNNGMFNFTKELHRSLFLGQFGKTLAGIAGLAMTSLCISGLFVLKKRSGGWRRIMARQTGTAAQKWHVEISRVVAPLLVLVSVSAVLMSAESFGFLDVKTTSPAFPTVVQSGTPLPIAELSALQNLRIADLRELQFPFLDDPTDVFSLKTAHGSGYIDQVSGELVSFQPHTVSTNLYEWIYLLHTGQGAWWLGLIMGITSFAIVVLSTTGMLVWVKNYTGRPTFKHNTPLEHADIVVSVGSEGNSTLGFARTLHDALCQVGVMVHTTELNNVTQAHLDVGKLVVLTSTHGDGDAPQNAQRFTSILKKSSVPNDLNFAVLGFGDSGFPSFCGFAETLNHQLEQATNKPMLPLGKIDKQCTQSFASWGVEFGNALGIDLELEHKLQQPKTRPLRLGSRQDYATQSDEPISVLRFESPNGRLPRFKAGDLVGVLKNEGIAPRLYSLASSSSDGFVEICVKRHKHGVCSSFLHDLELGDTANVFFRENAAFRIKKEQTPTIMVSAGTGIAPLIGIARNNAAKIPVHFYWGGRNPDSDYLYERELKSYTKDGRIHSCNVAFSRVQDGGYVQSAVLNDATNVRSLVTQGAQIMVCGGAEMALGLKQTLNQILAPIGVSVEQLKQDKRYVEDVY